MPPRRGGNGRLWRCQARGGVRYPETRLEARNVKDGQVERRETGGAGKTSDV